MTFLRNAWYMTGWADEIGDTGLARRIAGQPLFLYRRADGTIAALLDRCPHRFAPLSKGRRDGDVVVCGYHGLGFGPDDVVLAYAGSAAGWQSFALLEQAITPLLVAQPRVKVLLLCPPDPAIDALTANWIGRALRTWVDPSRVNAVLAACDMALLLRADTVTNRVASPTKFAEYLASGLPVIISAHIGDCSEQVQRERLGIVHQPGELLPTLERPTPDERDRLRAFALAHYSKAAHEAGYRRLLQLLAD